MKRLLLFSLILAFFLTACSGPIGETTPTSAVNPTTTTADLGLGKAADYSSLMALILKAQGSVKNPIYRSIDTAENAAGAPSADGSKTGDGDISRTNIQVEGVDEADIIKTDGRYLYAVANNRLYIIDTVDPSAMKVLAVEKVSTYKQSETEQIYENPVEIFLDTENQRLVLILNGSINTIYVPPVETSETKPTETIETLPTETSETVETEPSESTGATETSETETSATETGATEPSETAPTETGETVPTETAVTDPTETSATSETSPSESTDATETTSAESSATAEKETAAASDGEPAPDETVADGVAPDEGLEEPMPVDRIWNPYYQTRSYTTTRIYDISDKANPKIVRQYTQEGYYLTSRKINEDLYVVSNQYKYRMYAEDGTTVKPEDVLPCVTDDASSGEWDLLPPEKISILPDGDVNNQLIISGIDTLQNSRKPDTVSLIGSSGMVYASAKHLYVAGWGMVWDEKENSVPEYTTDLYRFSLSDSTVQESGKGSVPGSIINQFSMDEHNGYFRIATTTWGWSDNGTENLSANHLYVLDGNLKIAGKITGLAKGETIQSVRFMGDQAFVVTFRQVDPLFVIDLKVPTAPVVLGQLKIPGYSTYLHPYGENLLLGFGYDVKVDGDNAYTMGMKVSVFDVSDFNNPKEVSTLLLGGRGSYSDLLYNHKSLLFSKDKNLIAFPAVLTKLLSGDPLAYAEPSFQGLLILEVGAGNQLNLRGSISHFDKLSDPNGSGTLSEKDYNAFYGYDAIYRGAFIGNTLFTFSGRQIRSASLDTLKPLDQVELPGYDEVQNNWYYFGRGIADLVG